MTKASLDIIEIFNVFRDEIKINVSLDKSDSCLPAASLDSNKS